MKKICQVMILILAIQCYAISVNAVPHGWGTGWSDFKVLSTATFISPAPTVLTDLHENLHVFWLDQQNSNIQVKYMMLDNRGQVIHQPYFLTSDPQRVVRDFAVFLDNHNQIQLFYSALFNGDFQLRFSLVKPGKIPQKSILLKDFYRPFQGLNGVKDSKGCFHLIWSNSDTGNHELYYSKLAPDLGFVIDSKQLSHSKGMTTSSSSVIDSNDQIHIIYNDNRLDTSWSLEYIVLDANGNPLIYPQLISPSMKYEDQITPEIVIDHRNQIYIFWCQMNRGGYGSRNFDIYYTVLTPDFKPKYKPILLSEHPADAYALAYPPSTFVDDNNLIHTVWADSIVEPTNLLYKVIQEDQVVKPLEKLAISLTAFIRPTFTIDSSGYQHLFFMEIIDQGKTNLAYMNTYTKANITYWHWAGLDEDNLIFSTFYRLIRNLSFAAIGVLLNGIPILLSTLLLLFLNKIKTKINLYLKGLAQVSTIALVQLSPLALTVIGITVTYKISAMITAIALFLFYLYLTRKHIKYNEVFAYLLGGVIYVFLYIFISLWPASAILLR